MVDLRHVALQSPWGTVHLLAVVSSAGAVDVEAGQDLGNRFVDAKHNLNNGVSGSEERAVHGNVCGT